MRIPGKELQERWNTEQLTAVLAALTGGRPLVSPFGQTEEGLIDLRGLRCDQPLVLNSVSIARADFSHAAFRKLLCIRCRVSESLFRCSTVALLNNGSRFESVDFSFADLAGSGAGGTAGAAEFLNCRFNSADLRACIFKEGMFDHCDFAAAKLSALEFGTSVIADSRFEGKIKKCFFRGVLTRCDFQAARFVDCAFYGVEFKDCRMSSRAFVLKNWASRYEGVCVEASLRPMSTASQEYLARLCRVWPKVSDVMRDEVIDWNNLVKVTNEAVADEIFEFLKEFESPH
jgi:uncharacterized protein YjbI with pentapeptide repeats